MLDFGSDDFGTEKTVEAPQVTHRGIPMTTAVRLGEKRRSKQTTITIARKTFQLP